MIGRGPSQLLLVGLALATVTAVRAADWPQFRGPDRSNIGQEAELADAWPKDGPPLAWKAAGLKDGVVPVSVAGGRVFTTGNDGDDVVCTALAEADGKLLWSAKVGPAAKEMAIMRFLAQNSPVVDGPRVYVVTSSGDYACLAADTGKEVWRKNYLNDFDGKKAPTWGYCDYPLVDGDRFIICPGGDKHTVAALDKATGGILWSCPIPGETTAHSVLVPATLRGVKQYVVHLAKGLYGVSAEGKLLWAYHGMQVRIAVTHAPVVWQDEVFFASGYGAGHVLLKPTAAAGRWDVAEVYRTKAGSPGGFRNYLAWLGGPTRLGDRLLINTQKGVECLAWKTGETLWKGKPIGRSTYTVVGEKLFVRTGDGRVLLGVLGAAEAGGYRECGQLDPPHAPPNVARAPGFGWTFPVVANGRLYLRDFDLLFCYDVRAAAAAPTKPTPPKKVSDAAAVPSPPDVVARMLELAEVKRGELVVDLGSGDGRIAIAAAKAYGARGLGVEIEDDLVALARRTAKEEGVEGRVAFVHGDLFKADFSHADVVALYILPDMLGRLVPKFEKLRPGARIVTHFFAIPGVPADRTVRFTSDEDGVERPLHLYKIPLKNAVALSGSAR